MGWYHVDHFGKGIFMGEARKIKYNEDFLAKYVPSKEEAVALEKGNTARQNSPIMIVGR